MNDAAREVSLELLGEALRDGGAAHLRVSGDCMEPLVRGGDRVEVRAIRGGPALGDVVVARGAHGGAVCHRIVGRSSPAVRLAGDHSVVYEEHPAGAVLGRVHRVTRGGMTLSLQGWLPSTVGGGVARLQRGALAARAGEGADDRLPLWLRAARWALRALFAVAWIVAARRVSHLR